MAYYQATITFGTPVTSVGAALIAAGLSGAGNQPTQELRRLIIEPLRANTHTSWVNVGLAGTPPTVNATNKIKELYTPTAGSPLDQFLDMAGGSDHNIDVGEYYVQGTSGEGCTVGAFTI